MKTKHSEIHSKSDGGTLRAAVLGANDGIVSTASLILGVVAAHSAREDVLLAGVAGLVAGTMSMAAGEYVSVSSQADAQRADLAKERAELEEEPEHELRELASIYRGRGLSSELARKVAEELTAHDALEAHARDELGILEETRARPIRAASASALAFAVGSSLPLFAATVGAEPRAEWIFGAAIGALGILGSQAARLGGAGILRGTIRVLGWGVVAMLATSLIGSLFQTPVH